MKETGIGWNYDVQPQNTVRNPNIFNRDIDLVRRMAYESMQHSGYEVDYYDAIQTNRDLYQDPITTWADAIHVSCIFEDQPKVKVLKELGWYSEDDERLQIIYLPMYIDWLHKDVFNIHEESLIKVYYFGQNYPTEFRITDKRMDTVYGSYWICKLAPERLDNFEVVTSHGSHYLQRKLVKDGDIECNHQKSEDTKSDERTFHNDDMSKYDRYSEGKGRKKIVKDQNLDENITYEDLIMMDDN